jgi:hypothetical protein
MKRGGFFILFGLAAALIASSVAFAAVDKVICVPWEGDTTKQHTALSGVSVQLTGVVKTTDTGTYYYKWVFGDGTPDSAVTSISGTTKYNIAISHTYTAATGTPFTAQLQVADNSAMSNAMSDPYLLRIENSTLDAQVNIAIDKGLWWLHTTAGTFANSSNAHTYNGSPQLTWDASNVSGINTLSPATASAIQAFSINNHKIGGNPNEDPYVEDVQLGMNYLIQGYNGDTGRPALYAVPISPSSNHPSDNPDQNGNGYGVENYDHDGNRMPYEGGQVMDAIIASGVAPSTLTGRDFTKVDNTIVHNWSFGELLQDMADMYAWGQNDLGTCNGGICGSWWYNWNYGSPGDNSASQWAAIGLIPAQDAPWNVMVPQWERDYNANWLAYSMGCTGPSSAVTACTYNYFSYNAVSGCAGDSCEQTTTSGMVQMIFDGQTTADLKWDKAEKYIADRWRDFIFLNNSSWGGYKTYGWYSFAKAMRLSLPTPTTQLVKTSGAAFDWYYGNPGNATCASESTCEKGLAKQIVDIQAADGHWDGNLASSQLVTPWVIVILSPTLFQASPSACFTAQPNPSYANEDIFFNPSCSTPPPEPGKTLVLYEWDWNNDGTFDQSTPTPDIVTHQFPCAVLPCAYPVVLRVTDDSTPPRTATTSLDINITNPPHPPVANAGGPYTVSLCANDTLTLNGSGSYDPDQGQHETGCNTCPDDTVTAWDWDLTDPLTFTPVDESGQKVTLNAAAIGSFFTAGTHNIGLRVTDNTALAYPNSGQPNLTNAAFTTVDVETGCICNLAARAKLNKIQLTWVPVGGALSYDIYRSTTGPDTGFVRIAQNLVTTYATYLDEPVVTGTKYYYRVVANLAAGGTCGSIAASATPTTR